MAATLPMFVHLCNLHATKGMYLETNTVNPVFCVELSRTGHFIPKKVRFFHREILGAIDMAAWHGVRYYLHAR